MKFLTLFFFFPLLLWGSNRSLSWPPMDVIYHPISTNNQEAQNAFNEGLTAYFAFDYEGAFRAFQRCHKIAPQIGIAYWGMAIASDKMGRNVKELLDHAKSLENTPHEKAYIDALAKKVSHEKTGPKLYLQAMKQLVIDFPDDLDGAALYAESVLDKSAWVLWKEGKASNEAITVISLLESILKRDPQHLGANHYYIHTIENSPDLMRALFSAEYFYHLDTDWGHFVHSGSHIFLPLGYYQKAVDANIRAIEIDQAYADLHPESQTYRMKSELHEAFFLWIAYLWQDNYTKAFQTAERIERLALALIEKFQAAEDDLLIKLKTLVYFHKWNEILAYEKPDEKFSALESFWHFARGMAFVGTNQIDQAEKELSILEAALKNYQAKVSYYQFKLGSDFLRANLAYAKGNLAESITQLYALVEKQNHIGIYEWFFPFYQTLGARLIEAGFFNDAEMIFRHCLERYPRNGRALFGLSRALLLQKKPHYWIEREAHAALLHSDHEISLKDF